MLPAIRNLVVEVSSNTARRACSVNGLRFTQHSCLINSSAVRPSSSSTGQIFSERCSTTRPCSLTPQLRLFSTTPTRNKRKDGKVKGKGKRDEEPASKGASSGATAADDPFDFSDLQTEIREAVDKLKDSISKLRAGGRFNPEVIETLRVSLTKGSKDTLKLGELAQVIPKGGRTIALLVGEEDHIKPISSAIASSNLSLNPQPDAQNALQLNIPIPPPTKESRDQAVKDAKAAMDKASSAVRNARGTSNKKLKALGVKKVVRPDDLRKALEQMEKVAEKGQKEVKDVFDSARKVLEQG
ncbi:hypothetical protein AJ80_04483 [Polytolypa hystricis UAMH7299]|uniref:Ribosome recycling factor domain-containing protein n=1 Tax=Polytolypa hystricis (strain UAMH7299) TaxID=1447883 RepID=A0A2B7YBV4_POLH7|nr:hypothetical protein AJ80_04483 [Polytolypa hystricis UAMH7299]